MSIAEEVEEALLRKRQGLEDAVEKLLEELAAECRGKFNPHVVARLVKELREES